MTMLKMKDHKNFRMNERVQIMNVFGVYDVTGKIVGVASRSVVDIYIVQLDKPLPLSEWSCITMTESCLKRI